MSETVDHTGKVPLTVYVDPPPKGREWHEKWLYNALDPEINQYVVHVEWRLRPIVSATVTLEGIPRRDAELIVKYWANESADDINSRLAASARAALARKPELLCGKLFADCACLYGTSCEHDRNCTRPLGHKEPHAEVKPCPVMVCGLRQTACYSDEPDRCLDRRPCKHKDGEGHGGGHE